MLAFLTLIGGALGGLMRFVPEIMKLFSEAKERDHEFRMTELQLQIDKARADQQIDLAHVKGDVAVQAGEMQAYIEAIKGQSKPTGNAWIDGVNMTVRPFLTYWWMALFSVYKVATLYHAWAESARFTDILAVLWTESDAGILAMIMIFWFVDRSIRKPR